MSTYTQTGRPLRAYTALDPDVLLLETVSGVESVSRPFHFRLDLLSEKPDIDPEDLLRKAAVIAVDLPDGEERFIHGIVSRFVQLDKKEELTSYRAEVVPWLWFLSLSKDCKIYQEKSVVEIAEEVFKEQGYSDFRFKLTRSYPPREYCVQYRETHLDFVSRLLEEEGLFYFFEHTNDKHTLVITDTNSAVVPCVGAAKVRMARQSIHDEDVVLGLWREHAVHIGRVALNDYDYLQPSQGLEAWTDGNGAEESYDYPGKYTTRDEGERYTRLQMEAVEALHHSVKGTSTCRGFLSGSRFELEDHYRSDANQEYMLLQVQHFGTVGDYRSGSGATASTEYRNEFFAIPAKVDYRPVAVTAKPAVRGSQTALVVGPSGEEVYVDKHGRIKVQFYWDRYGQKNENSSCWIRVASPWAGKNWGAVAIPRIGNEVLVHFIEGDPDRPIVVASVYNAEQTPPFALPGAGIQMGMKSRSSKGGGGHNEITLTDTKGQELVNIHAQHNMNTTVLNDMTTTVKNDDTQTVENDRKITVNGTHTETIKKDTSITVSEGDHSTTVSAGKQTNTVNKAIEVTSETAKISVTAATEILLEVGAASFQMKADGTIKLKGVNISIEGVALAAKGSAKVAISGAIISSEAQALNSMKGAQVMSEGSATNIVKGGMVMLNPG
jgi:type VI secretion system secreted protein VgrG